MNQMRYKINESAPFDVIFTPGTDHGRQTECDAYFNDKMAGFDPAKYYDLHDILQAMLSPATIRNTPRQADKGRRSI
jgi:hypothetical protein